MEANRSVVQNGAEIALTGAEFGILLLLLARSGGKVLSRDEIAEAALGRPVGPLDRSIDNHISNVHKKLGASAGKRECIRNGNVISCKP
jgi:two-component system, OmpR family, response regulator CpxR